MKSEGLDWAHVFINEELRTMTKYQQISPDLPIALSTFVSKQHTREYSIHQQI